MAHDTGSPQFKDVVKMYRDAIAEEKTSKESKTPTYNPRYTECESNFSNLTKIRRELNDRWNITNGDFSIKLAERAETMKTDSIFDPIFKQLKQLR